MNVTFNKNDIEKIADAIREDLSFVGSSLYEDLCIDSDSLDDKEIVKLYFSGQLDEDYSILTESSKKVTSSIIKKIDDETEESTPAILKRVIKTLIITGSAAVAATLGSKYINAFKEVNKHPLYKNYSKRKKATVALQCVTGSIKLALIKSSPKAKSWWNKAQQKITTSANKIKNTLKKSKKIK